jgi:hypothetical protein
MIDLHTYITNRGHVGYKLANKQYLNAPFEDYKPDAVDRDEVAKWQSEIARANRMLNKE